MQHVIEMSSVNKNYPNFSLRDVNLQLPAGEIMGLVGVNGAGKSTIIRILLGLIQADAGEVSVLGYRLPEQQVEAKRDIGFASEDMRLYKNQTLAWHMNFIRSLFPQWDAAYAELLLKKFDLRSDQAVKGFSQGQRVKAALLLLLARRPSVLILDEPTTGLDPVARSEVIEELAEVLRDENRSVLFSSHNTHDIEQICDSITFIHQGQLLASQDTGSYLDAWRSIRCKGSIAPDSICLPEVAEVRQSGSLLNIKVNGYQEEHLNILRAQGLEVLEVKNMNLEEIFISTVKSKIKQGLAQ
jgi:ABC-2 type transport system ATP-binding protein